MVTLRARALVYGLALFVLLPATASAAEVAGEAGAEGPRAVATDDARQAEAVLQAIVLRATRAAGAERQRQQDASDSARQRAYLLLAAAGASAGAGTYLGVSALATRNDWESAERYSNRSTLASSARSKALFADISFVLALGLAATGSWLFLEAPEPPPSGPDAGAARP